MNQYDCFISWSGEPSCTIAQHLKNFLISVFGGLKIFYSPEIPKGEQGFNAIYEALNNSTLLISVLTQENRNSEWLLYEAGYMDGKRKSVLPYLVNLNHITPPLGLKQYTRFDKEDTLKLIKTLSELLNKNSMEAQAKFNQNWDTFSVCIEDAIKQKQVLNRKTPAKTFKKKPMSMSQDVEDYLNL